MQSTDLLVTEHLKAVEIDGRLAVAGSVTRAAYRTRARTGARCTAVDGALAVACEADHFHSDEKM